MAKGTRQDLGEFYCHACNKFWAVFIGFGIGTAVFSAVSAFMQEENIIKECMTNMAAKF